jgi:hypothetical protein
MYGATKDRAAWGLSKEKYVDLNCVSSAVEVANVTAVYVVAKWWSVACQAVC